MPRTPSVTRALETSQDLIQKSGPRLWNAKRRIDTSIGLSKKELNHLKNNPYSTRWRSLVSSDIVKFVDNFEGRDATGHPIKELLPEEKLRLLKQPVRYFSRPYNVPEHLRKQVLFPSAPITLLFTPHLGPYYAQFQVPLTFGKLDLKSYLKNLYDVDVEHIRSFVVYQKTSRERPTRPYQRGKAYSVPFKKKMTVHLVDPFEWPEAPSENEMEQSFETSRYWESNKRLFREQKQAQELILTKASKKARTSLAEQAKALLEGKEIWQPTWRQLVQDARAMEGRHHTPLPPPTSQSTSNSSLSP